MQTQLRKIGLNRKIQFLITKALSFINRTHASIEQRKKTDLGSNVTSFISDAFQAINSRRNNLNFVMRNKRNKK